MSDDAIKTTTRSDHTARSNRSGRAWRYPMYAVGAVTVLLTIAYIDGGEEQLRPIVQSVSLPVQAEGSQ